MPPKNVKSFHPSLSTVNPVNRCEISNPICGLICCLCWGAPCHCLCGFLPRIKESTATRFMYLTMFIFTIAVSVCSLIPEIPRFLIQEIAFLNTVCKQYSITRSCSEFFGQYTGVYKLCAGQLCLHLLLIPLTSFAKHSRGLPGAIHNGFWLWKWLFLLAIDGYLFLYIHGKDFSPIATVMRYVGLVGGCFYITVNIFFMCQVTIDSNAKLLRKAEKNKKWHLLIWSATIILLGISAALSYVVIHYYSGCLSNKVISLAHTGCCCLLIVLTAVPALIRGSQNADLYQSSFIISYIMYRTWSALHSRPDGPFNVNVLRDAVGAAYSLPTNNTATSALQVGASNTTFPEVKCITYQLASNATANEWGKRLQYAGLFYYLFIALYKSVQHTSRQAETAARYRLSSAARSLPLEAGPASEVRYTDALALHNIKIESDQEFSKEKFEDYCCSPLVYDAGQGVAYNEVKQTAYSYGFLHFQFACSILFVMMTLTHWFEPGNITDWQPNWAGFWVDIISVWFIYLVYLIALLLPPTSSQNNKYYETILKHLPASLKNRHLSKPTHVYYDKNGKKVKDMKTFSGVLYMYDESNELQPVRRVAPINEAKPSETTIDQLSGRLPAKNAIFSSHYPMKAASESDLFTSETTANESADYYKANRRSVYFDT